MPRQAKKTTSTAVPPAMLDTREVAAYLRLKERRIYDLVARQAIPHVRATGKLLFPRAEIDAWLARNARGGIAPGDEPGAAADATGGTDAPAPIIAGSHDPLLEWAARESGCGLAMLACGSRAGIERLAHGQATAAAVHWRDAGTGEDNVALVRERLGGDDFVMLEWARRTQGLLLPPGNPRGVRGVADLARKRLRIAARQAGAGSQHLFLQLLAAADVDADALAWLAEPAHAETELAARIQEGHADAGFGIEAAARAHGLDFIALTVERVDLVARRRDAFEPALQALLAFARTPGFAQQARRLGGYDIGALGRVVLNA
jgi:excisionase family DNA binding protein